MGTQDRKRLEKARKGRFCPFRHNQNEPAAESQSNLGESHPTAARSQARAWRAGLMDS